MLEYNPDTGAITWRISRGCVRKGAMAGTDNGFGYLRINMGGERFLAHRLAWLMFYGEWPAIHIDHINNDKRDNRITNLRLATKSENAQNVKTRKSNNTSGFIGVCYVKRLNKWQAQIGINGKLKVLGKFRSPEMASAAYQAAKKELHPFSV